MTLSILHTVSQNQQTESNQAHAISRHKRYATRKVLVVHMDIAYKMVGTGDPIILISPAQADMNAWDPSLLNILSANYTVIVFDN